MKDKANAAKALLGCSGASYHTAWDTLVCNLGQPQTVVIAQMKLIHTYAFNKSHESAAIIKNGLFITTFVSVLNQYGFTGYPSSQSVLNSAVQKLPPELKTKRLFYSNGQKNETTNFNDLCEWSNDVFLLHDKILVQF